MPATPVRDGVERITPGVADPEQFGMAGTEEEATTFIEECTDRRTSTRSAPLPSVTAQAAEAHALRPMSFASLVRSHHELRFAITLVDRWSGL